MPSSGLVGVAIAIATCQDPPDVFGFGNQSDVAICDHYWECRTDQGAYLGRPTHSFGVQLKVLRHLSELGAIRLFSDVPSKAFRLPNGIKRLNV